MSDQLNRKIQALIVDDEEIVLSFIQDALDDEGLEITVSNDPNEALKLAESTNFDLIITDVRMPNMDGIELITKIRENDPLISVIFMTGYANINSAKNAIKHGATDYIMKPFELSEIRQAVQNAIDRRLEVEGTTISNHQLQSLSELNNMLFDAGDKKSLIISSLKFAMMHLNVEHGSTLFYDEERERFIMISIFEDTTQEKELAVKPIEQYISNLDNTKLREPVIISSCEEHPVYKQFPDKILSSYLCPNWFDENSHMIVMPVVRSRMLYGLLMFNLGNESTRISAATKQFLTLTSSQLAITLENLSLLDESQKAYKRLKDLQDVTIDLEKMATKGQMSAEIGHELNNFLGVISGNISMIDINLRRQNFEKLDKYIESAQSTIEKITQFTANLMDLQPITSKKEVITFDSLIKEVMEYLLPQRRFRDITIETIHIDENIFFTADNVQIQQLLYNLFNNAADAIDDKNSGLIKVSVRQNLDENNFEMSIEDNGVGFDKEHLKKAFQERFTTKSTGHGFGLLVCNRIIEHHGGKLEIDSLKNIGTKISVTFPLTVQKETVNI